jgi:hypothetical protein
LNDSTAIVFFYSVGTGAGGIVAPWLFGTLIGTGERYAVMWGYFVGAILMLLAAGVEMIWGVKAEAASLEKVAEPLSAMESGKAGRDVWTGVRP